MKPQEITIESRAFWKYRSLMNAMISQGIEKMLATDTMEGSVTGRIEIKIVKETDKETGEIIVKPRFTFKTDMSVPVKAAEKEDAGDGLILLRNEYGKLQIGSNQIEMEELI